MHCPLHRSPQRVLCFLLSHLSLSSVITHFILCLFLPIPFTYHAHSYVLQVKLDFYFTVLIYVFYLMTSPVSGCFAR